MISSESSNISKSARFSNESMNMRLAKLPTIRTSPGTGKWKMDSSFEINKRLKSSLSMGSQINGTRLTKSGT